MTQENYKFGTWYPIESAPKDGTEILLANIFRQAVCSWAKSCNSAIGYYWSVTANDFGINFKPTHWMPLPPLPPSDVKEGE